MALAPAGASWRKCKQHFMSRSPSSVSLRLDTFSRLGEGFYSHAVGNLRRHVAASAHCTEGFSLGRSSAAGGDEGASWRKCKQHFMSRSPLIRLAIRSTPSPAWEKAFIVVRYARKLAILSNYRYPPHLISAPNHHTRGSGQRSWTQGVRSTTEGEKRRDDWAELAPDQAAQGFPCHGGAGRQCRLPFLFK